MVCTLTMDDVDIIENALNCLLEHKDYLDGFLTPEEVEKKVNPISLKLENATRYHYQGEQLTLII